jgi:tetratricopeptide (TPR) repeat protein
LADLVAQHLVASGRFLDDDPELAYQHARTARRLAARLGGVREAVAITAYLAEHYDEALTEFRAVRRMTGNHEVIAMMADCERALGRPDKALALTKDKHVHDVSEATQVELLIVAAGARRDKGQTAAAVQMLEVPELTKRTRAEWLPRLRYAYADALAEAGRTDDALVWFHRAAGVDGDGVTGAAERAAELEGLEFTDLDEDDTVVDDEYFEDEDTDITTHAAGEDADLDVDTDEVDDADEDTDEDTGTTPDVAAEDADLDVDTDEVDNTDATADAAAEDADLDVDTDEVDDAEVDDAGGFGEVGREGGEGVGEMTGGESKGDGE